MMNPDIRESFLNTSQNSGVLDSPEQIVTVINPDKFYNGVLPLFGKCAAQGLSINTKY